MSFLELAKRRYSVRNFKPSKVEAEKLSMILEAGRVAPTAANRQPHRLVVLQENESLAKVSKAAKTFNAPLVIIICGDHDKAWKRHYDGKQTVDIDTSIVADHMMLQATDLGLGSVWICHFNPEVIKNEFKLPDRLEPISILAIGYANGEAASPDRHNETRLPISEFVYYEKL